MADIRVKINVFLLFFHIKKHEYFSKITKKDSSLIRELPVSVFYYISKN